MNKSTGDWQKLHFGAVLKYPQRADYHQKTKLKVQLDTHTQRGNIINFRSGQGCCGRVGRGSGCANTYMAVASSDYLYQLQQSFNISLDHKWFLSVTTLLVNCTLIIAVPYINTNWSLVQTLWKVIISDWMYFLYFIKSMARRDFIVDLGTITRYHVLFDLVNCLQYI